MKGLTLITGAYGFVGSAVRAELSAAEQLTTISTSRRPRPGAVVLDLCRRHTFVNVPWSDITRVIHLAAVVPPSGDDFTANVTGTANLVTALGHSPLESFVLLSSVSVYGASAGRVSTDESDFAPTDGPYGRSKLAQEHRCRELDTNVCILRPSSIYGCGMAPTALAVLFDKHRRGSDLVNTAPRNYRQNFVHVRDVARLVLRCSAEKISGTYNLFSDDTLSMAELIDQVQAAAGRRRPVRTDPAPDGPDWRFSGDRIRTRFPDFTYTSVRDGLRTMAHG